MKCNARLATTLVLTLVLFGLAATFAQADDNEGYWHTQGNQILDAHNRPVKISGVNWYGFETTNLVVFGLQQQDYRYILNQIRWYGYNTIRIPFSNQVVETNPIPTAIAFTDANGHAINRDLQGRTALQILDSIVRYAGDIGLKIILDNHRSEAGSSAEDSGLWYAPGYPESSWIADWTALAYRYRHNSAVIGMDLRNEPHNAAFSGSCWTGDNAAGALAGGATNCPVDDPSTTATPHNWPAAATRAGNAVLSVNPKLLIFVEGVDNYADYSVSGAWNWGWNGANLIGVAKHPVVLNTANHVVYSPHDYGPSLYQQGWFNSSTTYASLAGVWDLFWGFIDNQKLAPVWVGEFGTPNANSDVVDTTPGSEGQWFSSLVAYIGSHPNMSWTYWALNGNDWFALLNSNWSGVANPLKQSVLSTIQSHQCH